jgi:hypothetical protein
MAVTDWNDPSLAQQTGLTEPALISLISASNAAGTQMKQLGAQVDSAAASIRAAMRSDAGAILGQRLNMWHEDFLPIIRLFVDNPDSLTERSTSMLNALRRANADSSAQAGANQG